MAFCGKCGTKVEEGIKFCPSCGAAMSPSPGQTTNGKGQGQNDFANRIQGLNNTNDETASFNPADIEQNKFFAILAYLSWLVLVPLFAAKGSKYARFHANQGLVLAITEIVWWIVEGILSRIIYGVSWRLGFLVSILGLVNIVFVLLLIIGILNAANGKAKELPIIGKIHILK